MKYQFKTEDDQLWVIDTLNLVWGKASSILSAPSVAAAEQKLSNFEYSESGTLVPMGGGRYSMDGRTPKDGLSTVGIMSVPFDTYFVLYLLPNVAAKEGSFVCGAPEGAQQYIKYEIRQPEKPQQPNVASVLTPEIPATATLPIASDEDDSQ
jgi:hypothetical protein